MATRALQLKQKALSSTKTQCLHNLWAFVVISYKCLNMQTNLFEDQTFTNINFSEIPFQKGEYEYCTFKNCNFSETDILPVVGFR